MLMKSTFCDVFIKLFPIKSIIVKFDWAGNGTVELYQNVSEKTGRRRRVKDEMA